jgi:glycosidase
MIFDFTWEDMKEEADKSSIEAVERLKKRIFDTQRATSRIGWNGIFLENHDQSRCVNKYLEKENICKESASALATLYFFLCGTPFIYEGQEIGMTNVSWNSIDEMDDVRAKGKYREAVEQKQDPQEVLDYFSELGRDNSRTPMQWSGEKNAGFTTGTPWDQGK